MHVRQPRREPRISLSWTLAALLAAASACGKVTATEPIDAAPAPPDTGTTPDGPAPVDAAPVPGDAAPVPPDANLGTLQTLKHVTSLSVQAVECLACMNDTTPQTHADNNWFLVLDLAEQGIVGDFQVARVQVGVNQATATGSTQPVDITLYTLPAGLELTRANLQFVATRTHDVPDVLRQVIDLPISARIAAGSTLVAEIHVPDGESGRHLFLMGCNQLGSSGPSYIQAPTCPEAAEITAFDKLNAANKHLVMAVLGYDLGLLNPIDP